jgi:hypothetical protein
MLAPAEVMVITDTACCKYTLTKRVEVTLSMIWLRAILSATNIGRPLLAGERFPMRMYGRIGKTPAAEPSRWLRVDWMCSREASAGVLARINAKADSPRHPARFAVRQTLRAIRSPAKGGRSSGYN